MSAPVRTIDATTFTGDSWAAAGSQTPPPADVLRLVVTTPAVRWRIVPTDASGVPIDDATTTVDACLILLSETEDGVETLARTVTLVECTGEQQVTGKVLTDNADEVSPGQVFVPALPAFTRGVATYLKIYVDAGAVLEA